MAKYKDDAQAEFYRDRDADLRTEALEADYPDYDDRLNGGEVVDPYTGQPIAPDLRGTR